MTTIKDKNRPICWLITPPQEPIASLVQTENGSVMGFINGRVDGVNYCYLYGRWISINRYTDVRVDKIIRYDDTIGVQCHY